MKEHSKWNCASLSIVGKKFLWKY